MAERKVYLTTCIQAYVYIYHFYAIRKVYLFGIDVLYNVTLFT